MEIHGTIKHIGPTEIVGRNDFKKRELILVTEEQYPQSLCIEFVQDKCAVLDSYQEGQSVSVAINLRGREWTSPEGEVKYFNTIQGWKIALFNNASRQQAPAQPTATQTNEDDLPF